MRRRASLDERMAEQNSISAKLQLSEAKSEAEDLRRQLVSQQAQLEAARLEAKREAQLAEQSMQASEDMLVEQRAEAMAVQDAMTAQLHAAQDKAEMVRAETEETIKRLKQELELAQGSEKVSAATTLQRAFHKRLSRLLQERVRTLRTRAEEAEEETTHVREDLAAAQLALQNSAARTMQKSLMSTIKAAAGSSEHR